MNEIRPYRNEEDRSEVADLILRITRHDGNEPLSEEAKAQWLQGQEGPGSLTVLHENRAIGYIHGMWNPTVGAWSFEMAVDPGHRSTGLLDDLVSHAASRVNDRKAGDVRVWTSAPWMERWAAETRRPLLRRLLVMGMALPAEIPDAPGDVEISRYQPGIDDAALLTVNNRAFVGHPENGDWDEVILQNRRSRPWFDSDDLLMARTEGRLVGFCWTKRHDPVTGEIYVLAVDPDFRRRGLGRFLLLSGLEHMTDTGCEQAILYVRDGEEAAERLYRSAGFRPVERRSEYRYP